MQLTLRPKKKLKETIMNLFNGSRLKSNIQNRLLFTLLALVGFSVMGRAEEPIVTKAMLERSLISKGDSARLFSVFAKARRGEPICIAAIGGSITAGGSHTKDADRRYVSQISKWFEETFPQSKIRFVNAGIGATDSNYGALRLKDDVLDNKPDLVVVEYAVNNKDNEPRHRESYEGLLRQLLSSSKDLAVIELFFMHKDGGSTQATQVELGKHYGLPMISFRDAIFPEFKSGQLKWENFYDDVVHPSNEGHDVASVLLKNFLITSLAKLPANDKRLPKVSKVPSPLITDIYQRCAFSRGEKLKPISAEGWSNSQIKFWECTPQGGTFEYEIPGEILHLGLATPNAAKNNIDISIDGAPSILVSSSSFYRTMPNGTTNGLHKVKLIVRPYQASTTPDKDNIKLWWVGAAGVGSAIK